MQTLGPGRHQIDADEIPGLGILIDAATAGRAYRAELYFVGTREYTGFNFGGRVDDVQDPQTGLIVTLRVFGDYALQVVDPITLITNLVSTVDVTDNSKISNWVSDQLLKVMRTDVTTQIVRNGWPILGLSAYTQDIEQNVIAKTNEQLAAYGVALTRMGNFDINLAPEDQAQLKTLAKDTSLLAAGRRLQQLRGRRAGPRRRRRHGPGRRRGGRRVPRRRARRRRHGRRAAAGRAPARAGLRRRRRGRLRRPAARRGARPPSARGAGRCGRRLRQLLGRQPGRRQVLRQLRPADRGGAGALHELRHRARAGGQVLRLVRHARRGRPGRGAAQPAGRPSRRPRRRRPPAPPEVPPPAS